MISKEKQYRTRDGRKVRIYAVDGGGGMPVHGAILENGVWLTERWSAGGEWAPQDCAASPYDLIEARPRIKREVWVNVYSCEMYCTVAFDSRAAADSGARPQRIACVRLVIDCEEGDGL